MRVTDRGPGAPPLAFLVADDDEDDWEFIANALREIGADRVSFVHNGQQLLDYLYRQGAHAGRAERDDPDLLLLDLKMPRMGGAEALSEIRADPVLKRIPVVVLTTTTSEDEINDCYERGANSVISKPSSFISLVEALRGVRTYWENIAWLPSSTPSRRARFGLDELVRPAHPVDPPRPSRRGFRTR